MKHVIFWLLFLATAAWAVDDQLIQQALKNNVVMQSGKLDTTRFTRYSSSTQLKLNGKVPVSRTVNGQSLTGNVTITSISGNAGTATALAANGTNCGAGETPSGVDASGNVEGCFTPTGTYTLPQANTSVLGGVKPDGTTITSAAGVISVANPLNQNTTGSAASATGDTVGWTDYSATSTVVGWSAFTTKGIYYKRLGKTVFVSYWLQGTSNSSTTTFTLPNTSSNTIRFAAAGLATDNGVGAAGGGLVQVLPNDNVVNLFKDMAGTVFTASGAKTCRGQLWYDIP